MWNHQTSWIPCFFGPIICHLLFSVRFVRICNIFCDFNDRNTVKTGNIFTPRLCFKGTQLSFIEFYTFLDNDFSSLAWAPILVRLHATPQRAHALRLVQEYHPVGSFFLTNVKHQTVIAAP